MTDHLDQSESDIIEVVWLLSNSSTRQTTLS